MVTALCARMSRMTLALGEQLALQAWVDAGWFEPWYKVVDGLLCASTY